MGTLAAVLAIALAAPLAPGADPCARDGWCVENPVDAGRSIRGLAGSGPNDLWAWGDPKVLLHWDGARWAPAELKLTEGIVAMAAGPAQDTWAATSNEVWRLGGKGWRLASRAAHTSIAGVWMPRAGTVWLLGETLERWDGYRFQVLPKVLAKGDAAVAAAGATEQEAWLLVRQGSEAFLLHPDGKKWSRLRVPFRADGALLRADASGLWVAVDGKLFHRTQTGWESPSAEGVAALAPSSSEAWLAGGPTAVWTSDERGIQPLPPVHGRVAAVWGVGSTDLWVGGSRGLLRHFDGKGWKGSDAVTLEPLISVGGTGGNDVWALGPDGEVLRRRGGEWSPSPHVPPEAGRAAQLWVGAGETWVAAANGCYRWSASAWTKVPGIGAAQAVWSRSPKDVWIAGKALFHWDGKQVKLVVEAPVGALFADVTGTVDRVWAILRGPRPEYAGGKSTGEPDDVVEVNGEQVARLGYPSRPTRLAVLKGKLWAVDTQLRRFEGDGWIPTRPAFGTAVDVAGTLLTLTPDGFAWARGRSGGQVSIPLGSLSDLWTDGQRAAWAVGSDGLIVRIHAAALK